MSIAVIGAGAFGMGLAVTLGLAGKSVVVLGRDAAGLAAHDAARTVPKLAGITLPPEVRLTTDPHDLSGVEAVLLAVPTQTLSAVLTQHAAHLAGKSLVACCKGIDLATLRGPVDLIADHVPSTAPAILSGPSFARDLAMGLPTALTLAGPDADKVEALQHQLSTPTMRLYRSTDPLGVQLGGALKNVIAIACGVTIGAGLGDSARAALMARGYAEMQRLATALGAQDETLAGLAGLGDLALTCMSEQSRNFRYGQALGAQDTGWDAATTTEGAATAGAALALARQHDIDTPVMACVAGLVSGEITVDTALTRLLSRPLKEE